MSFTTISRAPQKGPFRGTASTSTPVTVTSTASSAATTTCCASGCYSNASRAAPVVYFTFSSCSGGAKCIRCNNEPPQSDKGCFLQDLDWRCTMVCACPSASSSARAKLTRSCTKSPGSCRVCFFRCLARCLAAWARSCRVGLWHGSA